METEVVGHRRKSSLGEWINVVPIESHKRVTIQQRDPFFILISAFLNDELCCHYGKLQNCIPLMSYEAFLTISSSIK